MGVEENSQPAVEETPTIDSVLEEVKNLPQEEAPAGTPAEVTPTEEAPQDSKFEEIARRERELFEEKQSLKTERDQLSSLKRPDKVFAEFGIDPLDYAYKKFVKEDAPAQKAEEPKESPEIEALRKEIDALKTSNLDKMYNEEISTVKTIIDSEKHPTVATMTEKSNFVIEKIMERAANEFQSTKQRPSYSDLVQQAEDMLEKGVLEDIERYSKHEKYRAKMAELLGAAPPATGERKQPSTLTSSMTAQSSTGPEAELNAEEREEEFIRIMRAAREESEKSGD